MPIAAPRWRASSQLPPGRLEQREKLEQLRALEAGMRIDVALVDTVPLRCRYSGRSRARARARLQPRRTPMPSDAQPNIIAFQGAPGAYSDLACRTAFPAMTSLPCATFEDAFAAVRDGSAPSSP